VDLPLSAGAQVVRISLRDTGTGIPRENLDRIFDPFFTTKPVGKGSGLGLSVSLGIVRSFGGTILVDSDGESWTEFTVMLPASGQAAEVVTT
jgi:two-component system NtrC family sensor kinase